MKSLTVRDLDLYRLFVPADACKDNRSRLAQFAAWLETQSQAWYEPRLDLYRDHLQEKGHRESTVIAHLGTVRKRYHTLVEMPAVRNFLFTTAGETLADLGHADTPSNRKAIFDELLARLEIALTVTTKRRVVQDRPDSVQIRLTALQARSLINAPGTATLKGVRDTAILGMLLTTGVREAELVSLDVKDLRQALGGELALHVRHGKGNKERLIPYGSLRWVLALVDNWVTQAEIVEGAVFRGFYKGEKIRPTRLTTRAVQMILASYPVIVGNDLQLIRPHDLRRTYAKLLYDSGMPLLGIQQNLGHANSKTTLLYIGTLDVAARSPDNIL